MATRIKLVDLYSIYDEMDMGVIEALMERRDICFSVKAAGVFDSEARDRMGHELTVSVEEEKVENARSIIICAIRTGVISKEGKFRA